MKTGVDVMISDKSEIIQPSLVNIGNHVSIDSWVYISTQATIGDYVHIAPHASIIGGKFAKIRMDNFSNISSGVKIIVVSDDFTKGMLNPIVPLKHRNLIGGTTWLRRFTAIGVNSVVMPNVDMAEGSVLGANSLLMENTEPWGIYVGSPARKIGIRDKTSILQSAKELGYEQV